MNRVSTSMEHLLDQSHPEFLDQLDSDADQAFRGFYRFANSLLQVAPPRILRRVSEHQREDLLQDILLHCCQDEFRVLRTYSDRGRPFAVWFLILARNKILDHLRAKGNIPGDPIEEGSGGIGAKLADTKPAPDQTIDVLRVLTVVREVLAALGDVCRILIEGAAEGYRPRELVQLLGWKAEDNKKVSDSLRYCRTKLRAALRERGVGEDELRTVLGE